MEKSRLELKNIEKSFKNRTVVNGVSLYAEEGEIVGLLGPNGAGKTTTFKCLLGFLKPERGSVLLNGEDITDLPGTELEFVIMVIAVSCVKLLSAHNSTQHTSRKHKV
jgi:ABC-type (unclassified) transport system, ATPase component